MTWIAKLQKIHTQPLLLSKLCVAWLYFLSWLRQYLNQLYNPHASVQLIHEVAIPTIPLMLDLHQVALRGTFCL